MMDYEQFEHLINQMGVIAGALWRIADCLENTDKKVKEQIVDKVKKALEK